jgi:predicted AAA+ superfamily ATPase
LSCALQTSFIYYIELFEGAYLLKALQKYSKNEIGKRQSSPKIISMAPALNTFHRMDNLTSEYMGRVFESLVGAQLLRHKENIFYWSEGDYEVDFVLELQGKLIAIEVKSGKKRKSSSLEVFTKKYPAAKVIFITKDNYPTFEKDPLGFLSNKL